jgi:signal transduction histidine kinase
MVERFEAEQRVTLVDGGIGIAAELLPHIFDPYIQAVKAPQNEQHGLGLGLSIVRELVELHGGTIEAQSEGEGKGATFTVRLPV